MEKKGEIEIESEDMADSLFKEVLANFLVLMFMVALMLGGMTLA